MPLFYLRAFAIFFGLRAVSVILHYTGPSPWGGRLILSPDRFIPEALTIEAGIFGLVFGAAALVEMKAAKLSVWRREWSTTMRVLTLSFASILSVFSLVDFEVVRWLGQHMTASYIANFAGARDGQLFVRILSGDRLFSALAALQMVLAVAAAVFTFMRYGRFETIASKRATVVFFVLVPLTLASPFWLRPSEKRWRRIRPASISIIEEVAARAFGQDAPEDAKRAHQDLVDLVFAGKYDQKIHPPNPEYPLFRDTNVGKVLPEAFEKQPLDEKPDVILIVFETMRGMNTGFLGEGPGAVSAMPRLHRTITESARYFPRMHSAGYPSVAGAMGMHLGIFPHHSRIVFSSYLHVTSVAFPEMLRAAGYESHALLGADPSFSNFTPWFRRWYDDMEYSKENHHDGPLVDRFIQIYEEKRSSSSPLLLTLWTATTHPPYDVPRESGQTPADTNEKRYLQAMRYADEHISRLLDHLEQSPRWDRTLVFILGDHSQPVPWQWTHGDRIGDLNAGHTWTSLAILGGPKVAPEPKRDDRAVSHVDLGPTIVSAINLRHGNHFFGRDLLRGADERPVWAFRYGSISREWADVREIFRIETSGQEGLAYRFVPGELLSYGALEGGQRTKIQPTSDLARHRDMARAWAELLAEDRLAPH